MNDETVTELAMLELPFGRRASVREVKFESGLRMVRLVLREGRRITQVDMDEPSARELGRILSESATPKSEPG